MKKWLCVLALLITAAFPLTAAAAGDDGCGCSQGGFSVGKGTADAPYTITTAEELRHVESHPEACYILGDSIDLGSVGEWKPLCADTPFSGDFNGNNKVIRKITVSEGTQGGLFAALGEEAVVHDLKLTGSITVGEGMTRAGGLAATSMGTVRNINSSIDITVRADAISEVGGLVGFNGGIVISATCRGSLVSEAVSEDCVVGAIVGHSELTNTALLPNTHITAHSGFGAADDPASLKMDNTMDNIIHSVNYGPDFIEIDVRGADSDGDGRLEIWLGHDEVDVQNGVRLEQVLNLLAGKHERSGELNPAYADTVRIQLDSKMNGILDEILDLLDELAFPYARVVLAGDNQYDHVVENIDRIRAGVEQGMDFWMNPNFILSYEAMETQMDEFIGRIKALGLPEFTVNSNYANITESIQRRLTDEGIQISIWTLNDTDTLSAHMTRGVYNITTRLQEGLVLQEKLRTEGVIGSDHQRIPGFPEIGLCTQPGGDEQPEETETLEETQNETVRQPETNTDDPAVTTSAPDEKPDSAPKTRLLIAVAVCVAVIVVIAALLLIIRKQNRRKDQP